MFRLSLRRARERARPARDARLARRGADPPAADAARRGNHRDGRGRPRAGDDRVPGAPRPALQELPEPARGSVRVDPRGADPDARRDARRRAQRPHAASRVRSSRTRSSCCSRSRAQVAQSIEHAKLYAEAQRRVHELEALARISEAVSNSLYLEESLEAIVSTTMDALAATGAALVLDDGRIAWPEGVAGAYAMRQPLRWRGRQIGELVADRATPFTAADGELLASIATHAAVALEHGRAVMRGVLAQEIHHRVKNNLQTVASLLRLQARSADAIDPREALEHSVNRILAIAAVHELLTERRDEDVDLADLIERLRSMLVQGVGAGKEVTSSLETVALPGARATALALVFSELLQNALEHGGDHVRVELARPRRRRRARDRGRRRGRRAGRSGRHRPLDRARARPRRAARHARPALGRRHARRGRLPRLKRVVDAAAARGRAIDGRGRPGRQNLSRTSRARSSSCSASASARGVISPSAARSSEKRRGSAELGQHRDRPLAQQDVVVAGREHAASRRAAARRPSRSAGTRAAADGRSRCRGARVLVDQRVERPGQRLASDARAAAAARRSARRRARRASASAGGAQRW